MSDTPWLRLTAITGQHSSEELEDALLAAGAVAVTLEDDGDEPLLEPGPGETPLWGQTRVTGLFDAHIADLEQVRSILREHLGSEPEVTALPLEDRDWVRAWMEDYHPMAFGRRLWICPSHRQPPDPAAVNVMLDPGLAFGTGTHATTALCLNWLDGADLADKTVIDYGCGSGVLAIAAALLGARDVRAVDIDPQALLATDDNAQRNQVTERIRTGEPEALDGPLDDGPADILLANILAGPLAALAPRLGPMVAPGGHLVLAGLLERHADELEAIYEPWFTFLPREEQEGWVRLVGRRRG